MNVLLRSALVLLLAVSAVLPAAAQETPPAKSGCVLEEGQQTAADGSCGKWKARPMAANLNDKKAVAKGRSIRPPAAVIDLSHLVQGVATVHFCVTSSHDSHKDDYLIVALGPKREKRECGEEKDRDDCVKRHSEDDRETCAEKEVKNGVATFKKRDGLLKHTNGDVYWCVERRKPEERKPVCKYLPLPYGHTLRVWITQLHPDKTAPERQAEGTWSFVQALP